MSDLFNFETTPDPYAVMGNPITHSKSPIIHTQFAKQTSQSIIYQAIQVDIGGFPQAVGNFVANGGKGLNITVPFKLDAFQLVDNVSERAQMAQAVNTILVKKDGALYGDNTDGIGLVRDLKFNNHVILQQKRILVVGAGGAGQGIIHPLNAEAPSEIVIVNRTLSKAQKIADKYKTSTSKVTAATFLELRTFKPFDIIINATSASLKNDLPPLHNNVLQADCCCYDLMYKDSDTSFMLWAKKCGARTVLDGLGMLVEQAAESFTLWRDVQPTTKAIIENLRHN